MIEILVVDYQSEFSSDLLRMLVNIKGFTSPREEVGSMSPSVRSVQISCWARAKCFGFIPLWLAFLGLTSSFFLKGRCMKKSGFIHKGFGFFVRT